MAEPILNRAASGSLGGDMVVSRRPKRFGQGIVQMGCEHVKKTSEKLPQDRLRRVTALAIRVWITVSRVETSQRAGGAEPLIYTLETGKTADKPSEGEYEGRGCL
jgi:hypothetical protein